jgi:IS5 family transposase
VSPSYPSGSNINYTHAQWVTHNAILFGYKNYIEADSETKLTTGCHATTAVIHDSEVMDVLLDKEEDSDQDLYADSAYHSEAIEMACINKGINICIHEKGYRGRLLTKLSNKETGRNQKQGQGLNTSSPV